MKRSILLTLALVTIAVTAFASMNPNGTAEWLLQRAASKFSITPAGVIRIEPRSTQGTIATGKTVISSLNFCADAGSTDAYACSLTPAITAYTTGQVVWFKANTANTGAATINLNSIGAKTIKKTAGGITTDLTTNDIRVGQYVSLQYDGTNMQMLSASGNADAGGDVVGPGSATADAFAQFDGTTGKLLKSGVTLDIDVALAGDSDVRVASQKAVKAYADTKQSALTNPVVGAGASYKIARGVGSITGSGDVATGLTTVVAVTVTPQDDLDGDTLAGCSATIGNQAGAPAAGSVTIKCWKVTTGGAAGNPTFIAATAAKNVNWIAVGN